jgi:hypothetical protein
MRRRHYLATAAAFLAGPLAGCAHPNAVLVMSSVTDDEIATRASRGVEDDPEDRRIVAGAVENGTANVSDSSPPLDTDQPVEFEGRYYELTATETARRETTRYFVTVEYTAGTATPGDRTIAYDDLPAVDREALEEVFPPPEDADDRAVGVRWDGTDADREASVLVPESEYDAIAYEGDSYPVETEQRSGTESDYRYEAREIAAGPDEFATALKERYLFTLSGLPEAERDLVAEAIDGGYYEGSANDAFTSLARRFRAHEGIETHESGGDYLVRYDGTVYWADLQHSPSALEE